MSATHNSGRARAQRKGFTMIELLMVVTITGIMVGISASRFRITEFAETQLAGMQLVQAAPVEEGAMLDRDPTRMVLPLPEPVRLEAGTYWLSVQADMGNSTANKWFWVYQGSAKGSPFARHSAKIASANSAQLASPVPAR